MKYSDIIQEIDNIFDYFKFHNKNLTKNTRMEIARITRFNLHLFTYR